MGVTLRNNMMIVMLLSSILYASFSAHFDLDGTLPKSESDRLVANETSSEYITK